MGLVSCINAYGLPVTLALRPPTRYVFLLVDVPKKCFLGDLKVLKRPIRVIWAFQNGRSNGSGK